MARKKASTSAVLTRGTYRTAAGYPGILTRSIARRLGISVEFPTSELPSRRATKKKPPSTAPAPCVSVSPRTSKSKSPSPSQNLQAKSASPPASTVLKIVGPRVKPEVLDRFLFRQGAFEAYCTKNRNPFSELDEEFPMMSQSEMNKKYAPDGSINVLYRGLYSEVSYYKVLSENGGRVVVKKCRCSSEEERKNIMKYLTDIMISMSHDCPFLMKINDWHYNDEEDMLYLVMDMANASLHQLADRSAYRLTERTVGIVIGGVLLGLKGLHDSGWMHTDIKAENVLMLDDRVALADFNLCRYIGPNGRYCPVRSEVYMQERKPPEERAKQGVSFKADIWTVGVMTHLLLTSHNPFGGWEEARSSMDDEMLANQERNRLERYALECPFLSNLSPIVIDFLKSCLCGEDERKTVDDLLRHEFVRSNAYNDMKDYIIQSDDQ